MSSSTTGWSGYGDQLRRLGRRIGQRLYISAAQEAVTVDAFRTSYLASGVEFHWMGSSPSTSPMDLWIYQEILHEIRPDVVVAVATRSAAYLADICQVAHHGQVVTVVPSLESPLEETFEGARRATAGQSSVMVVIGSDADGDNFAEILDLCSTLVTIGGYLIVEDTQDPIGPSSPLPRSRSVEDFLGRTPDFAVDRSRERLYFTFNRGGFLKRH